MKREKDRLLTYISLFSSAGIGCYGFKQSGFECIATNEIIKKRLQIQKFNDKCRYASGYIDGDITQLEVQKQLLEEIAFWKQNYGITEPDVLIATPPCQGMSVANHKKKEEIGRNSLVVESIRLTSITRPRFFVFENVRGFLKTVCTDTDGVNKSIQEAISVGLGGEYNISFSIMNFKECGSHSSRTRTLVIGVRKDIENVTPYDVFPQKQQAKTLRELIGDLRPLSEMGEISEDIYHSFRNYDPRMLPWIEKLQEGQSAFENRDPVRVPHRIINGEVVYNKSKNRDKYSRWYWDRPGPCIHTRNDILASQNTVHPTDNRVFSIREIMRMLSIPQSFEWSEIPTDRLNQLTSSEKTVFLKREEANIRQCLGEAVPTAVFRSIADRIAEADSRRSMSVTQIKQLIKQLHLSDVQDLVAFIKRNGKDYTFETLCAIAEHFNAKRQQTGAYFTRPDIAYSLVKDLPDLKSKKRIRILEPSVGVGNFIPLLFKKYEDKEQVHLDVCDIDSDSLTILRALLTVVRVPTNFVISFKHVDFLLWDCHHTYDVVVGNPPFGKVTGQKTLLAFYRCGMFNTTTNNIFSFFIEKALQLGNHVSLIVPKSLLSTPEFGLTRKLLKRYKLHKLCDYGEKAFHGVKIETMSFLTSTSRLPDEEVTIESYVKNTLEVKRLDYITSDEFPSWVIYRDKSFDRTVSQMDLGIFKVFRDRQITKANIKKSGKVRVLKSRNIANNQVKNISGYDCYIDELKPFQVAKYVNKNNVVLIPNLSYSPRACFLPENTVADGSVALLSLKGADKTISQAHLEYYNTPEFHRYYRIARNYGTRSLNIDSNSVYFFGLIKDYHNDRCNKQLPLQF